MASVAAEAAARARGADDGAGVARTRGRDGRARMKPARRWREVAADWATARARRRVAAEGARHGCASETPSDVLPARKRPTSDEPDDDRRARSGPPTFCHRRVVRGHDGGARQRRRQVAAFAPSSSAASASPKASHVREAVLRLLRERAVEDGVDVREAGAARQQRASAAPAACRSPRASRRRARRRPGRRACRSAPRRASRRARTGRCAGRRLPDASASGALYAGVPRTVLARVSVESGRRAMPKSVSLGPQRGEHDVLRLHVAVEDAGLVRVRAAPSRARARAAATSAGGSGPSPGSARAASGRR